MSALPRPRWARRGWPTPAFRRVAACAAPRVLRLAIPVVLLLALQAAPAVAQSIPVQPQGGWRASRVLKWTLLVTSVGVGLWAWNESRQADDDFDALRRQCTLDPDACVVQDGRYANAGAEALYDRANAGDRRARVGLLAGQATLLGSAAFFIVDLRHGGPPENIPYDPDAPRGRARMQVGVRLPFPR